VDLDGLAGGVVAGNLWVLLVVIMLVINCWFCCCLLKIILQTLNVYFSVSI
jgi:hypothetical protein